MKVGVIIVNWNGYQDTCTCLESLKTCTRTNGVEMTVYVVDNGSTDNSVKNIRLKHPWVTLLTAGQNLGFTGGNNKGIAKAMSQGMDLVWLLNNDTFVHPDVLSFVKVFRDTRIGIAGSKIYFAPGHEYHRDRYSKNQIGRVIWYAGGIIDWNNMYAAHRGVDEVDTGQYDEVQSTQFVTGCSMILRTDMLRRIGKLDDKFYLYMEDVDLCLRAQNAGYSTVYVPTSIVWHVNAGSSGGAGNPLHEYYITRNRLLVGFRYAPMRTKAALMREALRFIVQGSSIRRRAVFDAMCGKFGKQYEPQKHTT